jgi:copper transport protein
MQLRRRARRIAGLAAAFVLAAGVVALTGTPAAAHANLVSTTPTQGAELDQPPQEVRFRFSERVTVAPDGITIRNRDGGEVATEPATLAPDDPTTVVLPVPASLPDGSYLVTYRVVSADSHPLAGVIVFGVGVPAGPLDDLEVAASDPLLTGVFAGARWTGYAGLALLGGGLGMLVLCWPGGWVNRRARRMVTAGAGASLLSAGAVLLLQGPYSAGQSLAGVADPALLSATLDSDYGRAVLARIGLIGTAAAVLVIGARPAWRRVRTAAAALVVIGLPVTWVGTGHANTSDHPVDVIAEVVHLVAMLTWFGGLAMLLVCLLPRSAALPPAELAPAVRRFSLLATGAVTTLVVTGTYLAWRRVGSLDALLGTPYGRLLAFKLATIGLLLWLGSMSRSLVQRRYAQLEQSHPAVAEGAGTSRSKRRAARADLAQEQSARAQLRGSVRLEAGTAVAVLALASLLVATPPGAVVTAAEAIAANPGPVLDGVALDESDPDTGVQILVDPAMVGENRVVLEVVRRVGVLGPPDDPNDENAEPVREIVTVPWDVPEVRAAFQLPGSDLGRLPVELAKVAPGVYQATNAQLPIAGEWRLEVTVRTSEIDSTTVQLAVPVA